MAGARPSRFALLAVAVLLALGARPRARAGTPVAENELKAVFIFHFTQFVAWPASAFHSANAPLVIGVAGDDAMAVLLDRVSRDESVQGHPLRVRRVRDLSEAQTCHLLYFAPGAQRTVALSDLRGDPILTVGDTEDFLRDGGMIRFVTEKSRLRLVIDLQASRAVSLAISTKLLKLAQIVGKEGT